MTVEELIGCRIKDILEWSQSEEDGLDYGHVFIELHNGTFITIPSSFDDDNFQSKPLKGSTSQIKNVPKGYKVREMEIIYPEGVSLNDIRNEMKNIRTSTLLGRLKNWLGIEERIPKKYRIDKTVYHENKFKQLNNLKVIDFITLDGHKPSSYIEFENGALIAEVICSPTGTGLAGLNYYENIEEVEHFFDKKCKRFTLRNQNKSTHYNSNSS